MNNSKLKKVIQQEYKKCAIDPVYFMKKYCYIQHPVRGKIPFHLFQFQERTLTEFDKERYNIVLKSRQTGISTLVAGFSLWKMLFNSDYNILIISPTFIVPEFKISHLRPPFCKNSFIISFSFSVS